MNNTLCDGYCKYAIQLGFLFGNSIDHVRGKL